MQTERYFSDSSNYMANSGIQWTADQGISNRMKRVGTQLYDFRIKTCGWPSSAEKEPRGKRENSAVRKSDQKTKQIIKKADSDKRKRA